MKYMEIPELASLSRSLHHTSAECTVHTRIEAYSCKSINKDKKLFATLEQSYQDDIAASRSPPLVPEEDTPFGPLSHHHARKTLYLLIATLNVAFPDYSFSTLRPDAFIRETSGAHILNALSTTLISQRTRQNSLGISPIRSYASYPPPTHPEPSSSSSFFPSSLPPSNGSDIMAGTHPALYKVLDNLIKLSECEVFSYTPDINADPHAGNSDDDQLESDDESDDDESDNDMPEPTFTFDEDDASSSSSSSPKTSSRWLPQRKRTNSSDYSSLDSPSVPPRSRRLSTHRYRRPRTPLLWSSHWFFYNRKLKRILFISVWARKKAWPVSPVDEEAATPHDTFHGWVGDVGAGARALGLSIANSVW